MILYELIWFYKELEEIIVELLIIVWLFTDASTLSGIEKRELKILTVRKKETYIYQEEYVHVAARNAINDVRKEAK